MDHKPYSVLWSIHSHGRAYDDPDPERDADRLKRFGLKGQTTREILEALMDRIEYDEFMEEQYRRLGERSKFVPLGEA